MKAMLVRDFGGVEKIVEGELPRPEAAKGEVLVQVKAAGVGPWDALIREGKSVVDNPLPVTLGSDLAGEVVDLGPGVLDFQVGDAIWGVTNENFVGAYAEYACASAKSIARRPKSLSWLQAASAPVVAVTAWQMLFEYAKVGAGQTVFVLGGAGNVGAYAVQLAKYAGIHVIATPSERDTNYVRGIGAAEVLDSRKVRFEEILQPVDAVIDTVGGEMRERALRLLKPQATLVSAASPIPEAIKRAYGARAVFFLVEVTTDRLNKLGKLFDDGVLRPDVGTVLQLTEARRAHEMLAGAPHPRGKIVLQVS
jgi:NADPH:quinone reductase-like Zn-dependent oxidoreductase